MATFCQGVCYGAVRHDPRTASFVLGDALHVWSDLPKTMPTQIQRCSGVGMLDVRAKIAVGSSTCSEGSSSGIAA